MASVPIGNVTTFHGSLQVVVAKRLQDAINVQKETICAGMLDHDNYKKEAGKLMGLNDAMDILQKAITDAMKG
jgi:hypothetical protein